MRCRIVRSLLFSVFCVFAAVALNTCGSFAAGKIAFPLYMDSIATIAVAALCGLAPSLIAAALSNGILAVRATTALPFMICHILTALFASLIFSHEKKKNPEQPLSIESFMWAGLASALSNTTLGSSFSYFLFKGNTGIAQVDNAVQGIFLISGNLPFAAYLGGTLTNLVDKAISALFSYCVYRIVLTFLRSPKRR